MEEDISSIISLDGLKFKSAEEVSSALSTMVKYGNTEAYVVFNNGKYAGKLILGSLIVANPKDQVINFIERDALTIKSDASLQQAIEAAANFIGESIPIVERESDIFIGTVNEGDIFKLYLELQGQTLDLEKR
jgi:CIC family chloride channel protein